MNDNALPDWTDNLPLETVTAVHHLVEAAHDADPRDRITDWPCGLCRSKLRVAVRGTKPHGVMVKHCREHGLAAAALYRNGRRRLMVVSERVDPKRWAPLTDQWLLVVGDGTPPLLEFWPQ